MVDGGRADRPLPAPAFPTSGVKVASVDRSIKHLGARLATNTVARLLLRRLVPHQLTIFMLHRFADATRGISGHDPTLIRSILMEMRVEGIPVLSLAEAVRLLRAGKACEGVVFTVDDGYDDFYTVGAGLFAEFGCSATVFLPTGFIDGSYWFWWDRIEYALHHADAWSIADGHELSLATQEEKEHALDAVTARIKSLPQVERPTAVEEVLRSINVSIPAPPPPHCAPMSWAQIRSLNDTGVGMAPHTVGHTSLATDAPRCSCMGN